MPKIKLATGTLDIDRGLTVDELECQFKFRKYKELPEQSFIAVGYAEQPIWWNRPSVEDATTFLTKEPDGLHAMNIPYWGLIVNPKANKFKTSYNFLLPHNSAILSTIIKYDETTSEKKKEFVRNFFANVYKDSLIELGVPANKLYNTNTDLYYEDRKFGGMETIETPDAFTQNVCITCAYEPEKEIFNRLKGKYAQHTLITGISEEDPVVTQKLLIQKLEEKVRAFIASFEDDE